MISPRLTIAILAGVALAAWLLQAAQLAAP
jgi:hypothetical protein